MRYQEQRGPGAGQHFLDDTKFDLLQKDHITRQGRPIRVSPAQYFTSTLMQRARSRGDNPAYCSTAPLMTGPHSPTPISLMI